MNPLAIPQAFQAGMMPQKKKGGMFGSGSNIGMAISAALNGYLAARGNPVGMMGLQQMQASRDAERQAQMAEQQYQRQRQDGMSDWVQKELFKRANPDPANPHYWEDNSGNLMAVLPGQQPQQIYRDPFQYKLVPNGMGGVVPVNIQQLMGGQAPQGVTFTPIDEGGPTAPPSGGFRSPY